MHTPCHVPFNLHIEDANLSRSATWLKHPAARVATATAGFEPMWVLLRHCVIHCATAQACKPKILLGAR